MRLQLFRQVPKEEETRTPGLEHYMTNSEIALDAKKALARFRVGAHCLHVETGRHTRPPTILENRICGQCNSGAIEDEIHFIMDCQKHNDQRLVLISQAERLNPAFEFLSRQEKFLWLMKESVISNSVACFIKNGFDNRV